jgi:hypothetical protein
MATQIVYNFMDDETTSFTDKVTNILDNMEVLYDKYTVVCDVIVSISGVILSWTYDIATSDVFSKKIHSTAKLFAGASSIEDFKLILKLTPKEIKEVAPRRTAYVRDGSIYDDVMVLDTRENTYDAFV